MKILRRICHKRYCRQYRVLAIETSCDDSTVCIINRPPNLRPVLEDHLKVTLDSSKDGGIIPIDAMAHHLKQIGKITHSMLDRNERPKIDLVCATQGPGMFSSLAAGLQMAKGLALAWDVPFIPVHHMLAHLLTPRFFSNATYPQFPFLTLLVSGGHTMLVQSHSLTSHHTLVDTIDNPIGNSLDKCARYLGMTGTMLGKELDEFVGDWSKIDFSVLPNDLHIPMALEGNKQNQCSFSFAHFASLLPRLEASYGWKPLAKQPVETRRALGAKIQDAMFTHIIRKTKLALRKFKDSAGKPQQLVCAGGVAANSRLRLRLQEELNPLETSFVPLKWCTDNALMIGWAGIEIYESSLRSNRIFSNSSTLAVIPKPRWPLDELSGVL